MNSTLSQSDIQSALTNRFEDLIRDLLEEFYTDKATAPCETLIQRLLDTTFPDVESASEIIVKFVRDNLDVEVTD